MKKQTFSDRIFEKYILDRFFKNTIYIRFKSDWIHLLRLETGSYIEEKPIIAIEKNKKKYEKFIIAFGEEAANIKLSNPYNIEILNSFEHPRCCIKYFEASARVLRHFLRTLMSRKWFVRPIVILHPLEKIEGGISDIERIGLMELAETIGSRKTFVWTGRVLTETELSTLSFTEE